ncbi:MAG: hypothetical protein RLZZ534_747 [Actinomycetota bacterium]
MATSYLSESVEVDRKLAIASALALRCEMSQVVLDIASDKLNLNDVLIKNADHTATKRLYLVKALEAIPSVGKVKARRLMGELAITEKRIIESLSVSERQALLDKFEFLI